MAAEALSKGACATGSPLDRARWRCTASAPGTLTGPADLELPGLKWWDAAVPGTAAGALADGAPGESAGLAGLAGLAGHDLDAEDWWFRTDVEVPAGIWRLEFDGLATLADVWWNGDHVAHSEDMFVPVVVTVEAAEPGPQQLVVRCAALTGWLAARRPRPRWKTYLVTHQNLRWLRTSLLGRIPGWAAVPPPVGPWRPVRLRPVGRPAVESRLLTATCHGDGGVVEATVTFVDLDPSILAAPAAPAPAAPAAPAPLVELRVGDRRASLELRVDGDRVVASGRVVLDRVERWWPRSHGSQPRYEVEVVVAGRHFPLGRVGFRTVEVERDGGRFGFAVNGQPVFCRGAVWFPPDPVHLAARPGEVRRRLALAAEANMNMIRVPATSTYERDELFDACDELGLMVWHDCMLAFCDPPADPGFEALVAAELRAAFAGWSGHPSLVLVCGSQEVEEVAAMNGLPPADTPVPLTDELVPALVDELLPGTPYLSSNPSGGVLPFVMDHGVSQYFGVGGYLRRLDDARLSGVRFASECLAFATPPERAFVDRYLGGATRAGHDPQWKRGVHHDAGRSWDMEDVRAHYQRQLFGTDPLEQRYVDPERALDLGRATNAHLMERVFSEWRRGGSSCDGGLVLALHDLCPGAGWGVLDASGEPKAPWYALRRVFAPLALLCTDEGLNGLALHVVNDRSEPFEGTLRLEIFSRGEVPVGSGESPVRVAPRCTVTLDAGALLGGFCDLTYAYRFAPPGHDVVVATLCDSRGALAGRAVHLPLGQGRDLEADVGLSASARLDHSGQWVLEVATRRFAQWVSVEVEGYVPEDSWFHLPPGDSRRLSLHPSGADRADAFPRPGASPGSPPSPPRGRVRALNVRVSSPIAVAAGSLSP